tara:strand:- start:2472 stop:2708 length:237 start_codon:yes stop_codon:yes gene_type:complete
MNEKFSKSYLNNFDFFRFFLEKNLKERNFGSLNYRPRVKQLAEALMDLQKKSGKVAFSIFIVFVSFRSKRKRDKTKRV